MSFRQLLAIALCVEGIVPALPQQSPPIPETKRVLLFSEMGPTAPAPGLVVQQIQADISRTSGYQVELYVENLETAMFPDSRDQLDLREWYLHRYRDRKIDAIVAVGPEPIRFVSEAPASFFPGVPVVICCTLPAQVPGVQLNDRFTGTWLDLNPQDTVDGALRLLPDTKHLFVVAGISAYDRGILKVVTPQLGKYAGKLDLTYLTDLDMPQLLARLEKLPADSIVLYLSYWQDAAGRQFINASTALPMIAEASRAPVFGISDTYMGRGIVGGEVVSFAGQGKAIAHILHEVLDGKRPGEIPVTVTSNQFVSDWKQLHRWNMDENRLPPNSLVLFRELTIWQKYWAWLSILGISLIALLGLTGYLLFEIRKRVLAERDRLELTGRLIGIQEDERRRLGREIHDDFGQRLAAIAYQLEEIEEGLDGQSNEVTTKLRGLWNDVSEFGTDLHALSHRLHSSVLENLGLKPGLQSLCREFESQNGIEVQFSADQIPDDIRGETALCLFRIGQEALRNVKKHSGAGRAQVSLSIIDNKLNLSIHDDGRGFAVTDSARRVGLGIRSMEERARLVGGQLKVRSTAGRGTTIELFAPLSQFSLPVTGLESEAQHGEQHA